MIIDPDFREVGEPVVSVEMGMSQAEDLSLRISDLLCWCAGFNAALGADDHDRRPMGVEAIRELNIALKRAMRKAEKDSPR